MRQGIGEKMGTQETNEDGGRKVKGTPGVVAKSEGGEKAGK